MANEKYGFKIKQEDPAKMEILVTKQEITIAQVQRGPQDLNKYRQAMTGAEAVRNPNRSLYYELAENVMTDGILRSVIDKRIRAVTTSPLTMDGMEDEEFIRSFQQPWMAKLLRFMMEAKFWGHSLVELELNPLAAKDPDIYQMFNVELIPRRNVSPEFGTVSVNPNNPNTGVKFRETPFTNYLLEFGGARDLGLLVNLIPYVIFKRNNFSDYAQYNELFGMPQRIYEYDPNQPETRKQLEVQAKAQGAAPYCIVPRGTTITQNQTYSSAGQGGFDRFHEILNKEITISVLGQTLTTGADGKGSYALGEIHQDVEAAINMEDKLWVAYQLNWVIKPLLIQTYGMDKLKGVTWKFDDTIKLSPKEKSEIFERMLGAGLPMNRKYMYEELNAPEPDEEDIAFFAAKSPTPPDPNDPKPPKEDDKPKPGAKPKEEPPKKP